jgi:hypothetical protein
MNTKPLLFLCAALAYGPACFAQATGNCTAEVKVTPLGLQKPVDDTRRFNRTVTLARYRINATASDKQCAIVSFNLRHGYTEADGTVVSATEAKKMRFRGGKGSLKGELPLKREVPNLTWSVEDLSCKHCK